MASAHTVYRPRTAEASVLHVVIRQHLEDFLRAAADRADGAGLQEFIAREFREFLACGVLAHDFARVRCGRCTLERLVPFSCKGRGFCPSCGGRRMTERAAHLVDDVLPPVPMRQWVLTLPYRLRYLLAWDHGLIRAVLTMYTRALLEYYQGQAQRRGIRDGRTGTLSVIQRSPWAWSNGSSRRAGDSATPWRAGGDGQTTAARAGGPATPRSRLEGVQGKGY